MKSTLILSASAALLLVACGPSEAEIKAAKEKATADSLASLAAMEHTYTVDPAASKVTWAGTMLGVKTHHGTLGFTTGSFTTKGPLLTGGEFTADLKTLAPLDTNYAPDGSKQGTKSMLIGHLSSADFFAVDSFPTASFKITSVNGNSATGDLTVRGKTNSETVTDIVLTTEGNTTKATGKLVFDRQKYGVAWSAGKDAVLNDNIELIVELSGTEAAAPAATTEAAHAH